MKYFILIIAIFLTACGGVEQKQPEGKEEHAHAAEEGNTATLTEEQMKSIGIELGSIKSTEPEQSQY
jgi:hypothetical protein